MLVLSGDQATSSSGALVLVRRRGGLSPSVGTSHRSLTALSVSYEGSRTEKTTHLPSGLTAGVPTRFIIHKASWVIGLMGVVAWAAATIGASKQAASSVAKYSGRFIFSCSLGSTWPL